MPLLDVVSYKTSSPDDLANLEKIRVSSASQYMAERTKGTGCTAHLENTVRLHSVQADLGPLARANGLPPVRRIPGAREDSAPRVGEGVEGRRLQTLGDIDLLQELACHRQVVHNRLTVPYTEKQHPVSTTQLKA